MTSTQHPSVVGAGAAELARRIAAGDVSATEVVEAHIARIREVDPTLNALVVERFAEARAEAAAADAQRAVGAPLGPLHGVPVTIKEQFLVAGTPTTLGLPGRRAHRAAADGPLVARLREAGAIVLGKSNVSQLLTYHESDNPAYGRTVNPWSPDRTPGGSSGGEAALVAAGGSPLGLAGDMGGSTRVPAHFTGVHGLKPTTGRLSVLDTPADFRISGQEAIPPQNGPIARTVEDLTLALSVLEGAHDPAVAPVPWRDPAAVDVAALRVAVCVDDGFFPASPAIRRATREAAAALAAAGATVVDWTPPRMADAVGLALALFASDGGAASRRFLGDEPRAPQVRVLLGTARLPAWSRPALSALARLAGQPRLAATLRELRPRSAAEHWQLLAARTRYREEFTAALDAGGFDLLLCPPHALPALRHGTSGVLAAAAGWSMLFNLLGLPAGVLSTTRVRPGEESDRPAGRDVVDRAARAAEEGSAGLPVGVQFAGRPWREDVVLAAMSAVEAAVSGRDDYPATALPSP